MADQRRAERARYTQGGAAGEDGSESVTRLFALHEPHVYVNANASGGEICVEVQEVGGAPFEGFALADCQPVCGDCIGQRAHFGPRAEASRIIRRPICLRVRAGQASFPPFGCPTVTESRPTGIPARSAASTRCATWICPARGGYT